MVEFIPKSSRAGPLYIFGIKVRLQNHNAKLQVIYKKKRKSWSNNVVCCKKNLFILRTIAQMCTV